MMMSLFIYACTRTLHIILNMLVKEKKWKKLFDRDHLKIIHFIFFTAFAKKNVLKEEDIF